MPLYAREIILLKKKQANGNFKVVDLREELFLLLCREEEREF